MDDGEHRVAAGRRVVGQEHDRLPARRHLDGAEDHPLARQLVVADPRRWLALEAQADPVDAAPTAYGAAQSRSSASGANQSARGPGVTRSGPGSGGRGVSSGAGGPAGAPTGSVVPSSTRGGPTQARVSVDREPSTGATSMPPATAT